MKFTIKNENSFIEFKDVKYLDDSQDFQFFINSKCGNFVIENKIAWVNKNELLNFYKQLQYCYENIHGEVESNFEYDEEIKIKISFKNLGQVYVECEFFEYGEYQQKCHIEFQTDQTFILQTLNELKEILD